jgi:hypothetical protein
MHRVIRELITLWLSLLILSGLSFLILQLPPVRAWLWQHTGEEAFLAQVKGADRPARRPVAPRR